MGGGGGYWDEGWGEWGLGARPHPLPPRNAPESTYSIWLTISYFTFLMTNNGEQIGGGGGGQVGGGRGL